MRALLFAGLLLAAFPVNAQDKVTFGSDWRAQAEHGGFYQAVAAGYYAKRGLDVTIRQGGPQINHTQLLAAARVEFSLTSNAVLALNAVKESLPLVTVAAIFQKDPQVFISHAGQGSDKLADLKGKPIMIGTDTRVSSWQWLKAKFGYNDDQIRPYNFNPAPFLADKKAIQQGYLGSEPFSLRQAGADPVVMLLADEGYPGYAALISTTTKLVTEKPALVQRFVDASIEGWYGYLYGDSKAADALIKKDNPEMTDDLLAFGREAMRKYGIVDSGEADKLGVGAMTPERWKTFYDSMSAVGVFPIGLALGKAYTDQFVNKRVGAELKK
jgi:NitT/TauT family transport system substrate-binding protein